MMIEIKKSSEETVVEIVGRLDTTTAPALDKTINDDIGEIKNLIFCHSISLSSARPFVISFSSSSSSAKISAVGAYSTGLYSVFLYLLIERS